MGNYSEDEIELKVAEIRKQLAEAGDDGKGAAAGKSSHAVAQAQVKKNLAFEAAMGISRDYEAGQAFDQDLQEERKAERIQQREHDQEKRERDRRQRDKEAEKRREIREKEREQDKQRAANRTNDQRSPRSNQPDRRDNAGRRSPARRS